MLLLTGCGGGPNSAAWQQVPLTLSWDQPDGLAEYFQVRSGIQLLRAEQPRLTLYLAPGTHTIQIEACNAAGCSEPAVVVVTRQGEQWHLVPAGREDRRGLDLLEPH